MFKKVVVSLLIGVFLIAPTMVLARVSHTTHISTTAKVMGTVKIADATSVIRLASSDLVQKQMVSTRDIVNKNVVSESAAKSSQTPPQAWLILTALICFVMRSSRRVV